MKILKETKRISVIMIVICIVSIFLMTIPSSAVAENASGDSSRSPHARAVIPNIVNVGNIAVTDNKVSIGGTEDTPMYIIVRATYEGNDELVFYDQSDLFDIKKEPKDGIYFIGNITFTPTNSNVGSFEEKIGAKEKKDNGQHEVTINFTIKNVNDPPELLPLKDNDGNPTWSFEINQDDTLKINLEATDIDKNDKLTYSTNLSSSIKHAVLGQDYDFKANTGEFEFTPDNSMVGKFKVKFSVMDSGGDQSIQVVNLTINNVNDPPSTPDILYPSDGSTIKSDRTVHFKGHCDDPDLEVASANEELTYTWISTKENVTTTLGTGADFIWEKPIKGFYTITLEVSDKAGEKRTTSIDLTIVSVYELTEDLADQSYEEEKGDLLLFTSQDNVGFTPSISHEFPGADLINMT
ncbi:MAG: hypothetical protein JSV49_08590 [Thermoplasmata archaeon]|nr:MAG: hypothetical protein JSV49_08590 [Thermoplasmata archaeon]